MKDLTKAPRILAALLALLCIAGLFLPYIKATDEYAKYLESIGDQKAVETADLTAKDMKEISLFEYAKLYWQGGEEVFHDKNAAVFYSILFALPAILGLLAFLCAIGKKGIPLILLSAMIGGAFYLINFDIKDRGIMPNSNSVWGITHSLYYPVAGLLLVCGIWLFVAKVKTKRLKKMEQ